MSLSDDVGRHFDVILSATNPAVLAVSSGVNGVGY